MKYDWTNLDDWEAQYIEKNPYKSLIAWTDEEAYIRYNYSITSLIYNKYNLIKLLTDQPVWDLNNETPNRFPVIIKPKVNLLGMGIGAYKAESKEDVKKYEDNIAQPFYKGRHITTDFIIWNSRVSDWASFIGHKDSRGSFTLFESVNKVDESALNLVTRLAPILRYGVVNIETISGKVIEAHLRPSTQFHDIDGGLVSTYLKKRAEKRNNPLYGNPNGFVKSYSRVYRRLTDGQPYINNIPELPDGVSSIQLCWNSGGKLSDQTQDEHSFRVMVINGYDLKSIDIFGQKLYNKIKYR